jgi:acyl-coenzyme A thioesterase PaaI-like protein
MVFICIRIGVKATVWVRRPAVCSSEMADLVPRLVKLAHGGQMITLMWEAVGIHFRTTLWKYQQPDTLSCHVEFLRTAMAGEAKVVVEDVSLGLVVSRERCCTDRTVADGS